MELADIPEVLHPAFPQPGNPNATIWRYMDIDKFRSLVSSGRLYMARADLLGDDFEGTTPSAEKEYWRLLVDLAETPEERQTVEYNAQQLSEFAATFRPTYYVSCWNMAEDENIAMWQRYTKTADSVAIRSTYSTLRSQLEPRQLINLGVVRYIDYSKERLPSVNMLHRITHKRHFHVDDREVRAVISRIGPPEIAERHIEPFITPDDRGFLQPVDVRDLIKAVVLHYNASAAFAAEVAAICSEGTVPAPRPSQIATESVF
jgi:hypothetical protein